MRILSRSLLRSSAAALGTLVACGQTLAHEGHGAHAGGHWHATDVFGFAVVGVLVVVAIWLGRGK